jgi:hypothetical protein
MLSSSLTAAPVRRKSLGRCRRIRGRARASSHSRGRKDFLLRQKRTAGDSVILTLREAIARRRLPRGRSTRLSRRTDRGSQLPSAKKTPRSQSAPPPGAAEFHAPLTAAAAAHRPAPQMSVRSPPPHLPQFANAPASGTRKIPNTPPSIEPSAKNLQIVHRRVWLPARLALAPHHAAAHVQAEITAHSRMAKSVERTPIAFNNRRSLVSHPCGTIPAQCDCRCK